MPEEEPTNRSKASCPRLQKHFQKGLWCIPKFSQKIRKIGEYREARGACGRDSERPFPIRRFIFIFIPDTFHTVAHKKWNGALGPGEAEGTDGADTSPWVFVPQSQRTTGTNQSEIRNMVVDGGRVGFLIFFWANYS